ncbi:DUF3857 domain-containing protein [Pontibacter ruber]|uniref:DUF3857 domain-containing protein n=1 Tax=Pontibacter ruber TaxID=1343895 RepID=A0ABW5D450_9BACT|nr:DUF3857 domain-containing protein [Pontibacter ruber]
MKANFYFSILATLLITAWYSQPAAGQSIPVKFGKVEESELAMRTYEKDTSAAAVVLLDFGYSQFIFGHEVKLETLRRTRIKILKKSGYDWANVVIPFYNNTTEKERVSGIKGYTYNLVDGKIIKDKLEPAAVFEERQTEQKSVKKFTLPNVKEGSVIEFEYTVSSDFIYTLRDWEFQTTIPTVWSEFRAKIPQYFDYKFLQHGYHPLHTPQDKYDPTLSGYRWIMKDLPALREEKYITTLTDYQSRLEFELENLHVPGETSKKMTGEWDDVIYDLLQSERFGSQLNRKGFFKNEVAAIVAQHKAPEQQMQTIYDLVKKSMKWNGKYGIYTTGSLRKAFENRTGNVAEVNLLLTAMLQEAGLDAAPVLVSTRDYGKVFKGTPLLSKFNYIIAYLKIGNKEYLLDATDPLLPAGMLPVRSLNGEGRVVKQKDDRWVALKPEGTYLKFYNGDVTINAQGEIKGKATESRSGYSALLMRKTIQEEGEDKYTEQMNRENGDFKISKPAIVNLHDPTKKLDLSYELTANGNGQANSIIYLNPMMGQGEKENPFKLNERAYPVDFAVPIDETYICRFTIPADYELEESPKSTRIALPNNGGTFTYMVEKQGNTIQVLSKIIIAKPIYYAQEYPHLKEFYAQVVAKHAEQLVLKKKQAN